MLRKFEFVLAIIGVAVFAAAGLFAGTQLLTSPSSTESAGAETLTSAAKNFRIAASPTSMLFLGDAMLGRGVEALQERNGPHYPFEKVISTLEQADFVVANLEGPIVDTHVATKPFEMKFSFPAKTAALLAEMHFDFLSLGNNHTLDQGRDGLSDTKRLLEEERILFAGDAHEIGTVSIATTTIKGEEYEFIAINATYPTFDQGSAVRLVVEEEKRNPELYKIVLLHWGEEYATTSNAFQQNLGHALVDAGADLIIGSHPHVLQEIEKYNGAYIFYSLGNFIFDQYFSRDVEEGLAVKLRKGTKTEIELLPYRSIYSQPQFLNKEERANWLKNYALKISPEIRGFVEKGIFTVE